MPTSRAPHRGVAGIHRKQLATQGIFGIPLIVFEINDGKITEDWEHFYDLKA